MAYPWRGWWVSSLVWVAACEGNVPDADGGSSTSADGTSEAASTDGDTVGSADSGSDDASTATSSATDTSGPPECGNGVVERGEECDDDSGGCVDCMRTCGFEDPVTLSLSSWTYITLTPPLVAIADGTGDFAVSSAHGLHRVTADGNELWVELFGPSDWLEWMEPAAEGELWGFWSADNAGVETALLGRHSLADGAPIEGSSLHSSSASFAYSARTAPDGDLRVSFGIEVDANTQRIIVERRAPQSAALVWTTPVSGEPNGDDGIFHDVGSPVGIADDGAVFITGRRRFDADTDDPLVVKFDADGTELWQRTVFTQNAPSTSVTSTPSVLPDGGAVFIVGRMYDGAGALIGVYPAVDVRVMRLDADGETVWELDLAEQVDSGRVQATAVYALDDGRIVVAGGHDKGGEVHPWLGVLDDDGTLLCSVTKPHPNGVQGLIAGFFVDAEATPMVQGWVDDGATNNAETEGRWMARLYPY